MMTPTMMPMMLPVELLLVSTAKAPVNSGGGGGATLAIVGSVTTASTAIVTPVTLANMAVALLGLLVALAIVDCTEAAVAVGVRMSTPTMTLPGDMVSSTADGSTPALAAVALLIWDCTLGVNEETSPASRRVNPTTLIAGGDGGGEGEGGGGEGGGGEGEGGGGEGSGEGEGGGGEGGGAEGEGGEGEGGDGGGEGGGGEGEGGGGKG
eukprot:jgi/Chrpa1/24539/Chrysochromulina_OHIO_Genome00006929-RA